MRMRCFSTTSFVSRATTSASYRSACTSCSRYSFRLSSSSSLRFTRPRDAHTSSFFTAKARTSFSATFFDSS